ncbi:MAG: hypothetical protein QM541_06150 [Flavobacterium sp.]|nr:hypothetical protein [Flavobacterium sp.]
MIVYNVVRNYNQYQAFESDFLVFSAIRKSRYLGDKVLFYNLNNELIAESQQKYFLRIDFGHKITFVKNDIECRIKVTLSKVILYHNNDVYEMRYPVFGINPKLYLNNMNVGEYEDIPISDMGKSIHQISCEFKEVCHLFSMMDVIMDYYSYA